MPGKKENFKDAPVHRKHSVRVLSDLGNIPGGNRVHGDSRRSRSPRRSPPRRSRSPRRSPPPKRKSKGKNPLKRL